jgi:hypothetical protein
MWERVKKISRIWKKERERGELEERQYLQKRAGKSDKRKK